MARRRRGGQKTKSARQVRFLFSSGSPLAGEQKQKLASEIRTGKVKIRGKRKGG